MKVHEYQARALLQAVGVPVPPSEVIERPAQAAEAFRRIGAPTVVVKAQVHAGGRGKAGYVKLVHSPEDAQAHAARMFREPMVSKQTGPEGIQVRKILLAAAVDISKEYYVGVVLDRARRVPVLMASAEGGVEIEEVAARNPEAIRKAWFHPHLGLRSFQATGLAAEIGLTGAAAKAAADMMMKLAKLFLEQDCSLAEINPLVQTPQGEILAIDAKFNFDDNALFRHPDLEALFDPHEENAAELQAKEHNLSYIALDGNIGCLVNGAGLAMATMDIIKLHGGEPANFLDVGGSVTPEGAVEAFRIILADAQVKAVLVNIFGGIARCDVIADALIQAGREVGFKVPVVVRLEGTNVERARQMLKEAAIPQLKPAADLTDAARQVCAAV
ncbi:MAG: ADP-forming succinate--CoA ligase subunit beta [Phycisphaerales bacterium]|nr:ADP-forming succinate--CoA ligase subunit beta [Phycisphaerales bacterium]